MSQNVVEDFAINRHLSQIHNLTEWDNVGDKNFKYYNGERFFKISRKHYPKRFTRGWLWGYYDNLEDVEKAIAEPKTDKEEGEIEREF